MFNFSYANICLYAVDKFLGETLLESMRSDHIQVHTQATPVKVSKLEDQSLLLQLEDGTQHIIDCLIWAVGREPNTKALKLERTNIQLDDLGYIQVDQFQNTSQSGLYAVGDIIGKAELTICCRRCGSQTAERLFNGKAEEYLNYENIPTVVFSHPHWYGGFNRRMAIAQFGQDQIKVYSSSFTSMYTAVTQHRQVSKMKLICAGVDEKNYWYSWHWLWNG